MKGILALLALLAGLSPAAASAQAQTWPIDPAQSQAQFSVRKFWFIRVRGTFPDMHGTLRRTDAGDGEGTGQVTATLEVAALQMRDAGERAKALGPDFFDAARFPLIQFESDPFPLGELDSGGPVHGRMMLHGEQHPVTLALQPSSCPQPPLGCVIRVRGAISRSRFGMRAVRGLLSDRVELDLNIVLGPPAGAAAPPDSGSSGVPESSGARSNPAG